MRNRKFNSYIALTSLGFIAVVVIGLFMFLQLRGMVLNYSGANKRIYSGYVDYLNKSVLANMSEYIEERYPSLCDTALLKQKAGTDWFWDMSGELKEISKIFNFAYIYYIEKKDDNYIFLMSSGIQRDKNSGLLGQRVWKGPPPSFIDEAWATKQVVFSREPTSNEWGTLLISVARPIISNGNVVGILGIDYDISFLGDLIKQELHLQDEESDLMLGMRNTLIISIIVIIAFMALQIRSSVTSTMVSLKDVEADERTRLMLESTPMLCSLRDENFKLIDCDGETLKVYGLSDKAEYIGHFYDLTPEYQPTGLKTRDVFSWISNKVSENGYVRKEWMSRTAQGEDLPLETTVVRVPWKNSYHFAVYSRDLREDKAREAALQESENRLRVMVDTMAFACLFFDQDRIPIDCNQLAIDLFKSKSKKEFLENFIGYSPHFQPDGRLSSEMIEDYTRRAAKSGRVVFSWRHLRADGTPLPVEVTLVRVQWKDGYRIIAYLRDLSELVETEDKLRKILATTEASPDYSIFLGPNGNIEYLNPAVINGSGYSNEELQKGGLALLFSREDYELLYGKYITETFGKGLTNFEMTLIDRNGRKHDFYFSAFSVQLYDLHTGIGILGRDITAQKQMQRDLAAARDQAERALAAEVQYNQAKSDFLSRVSHELRTPLNAIIGISSTAGKSCEKCSSEGHYAKIRESSEHLLDLVNDIIDMTGFDTGKFDFVPRPFSFRKALRPVIDSITQKAGVKKQTFTVNIDDEIYDNLLSDERRMKQVLLNLLYNAVKFTPENGKIELSARNLENSGNECTVRFEVIDNGPGISAEIIQRIGRTFEQADNSITREHGGLGLGLSLTKRIVIEMMNGNISVESEPGKGSRFICDVRFGIAHNDVQGADEMDNPVDLSEDAPHSINLKGKRLLIVDDVEINRDILLALLEDTGADIDSAKDGSDAVRLFSKNQYDLVLMDLHMPVMSGYIATQNIRALPRLWANSTPIISVSAESSLELRTKCLEAGMNDHLAKPVTTESLFAIIAKWLPETIISA